MHILGFASSRKSNGATPPPTPKSSSSTRASTKPKASSLTPPPSPITSSSKSASGSGSSSSRPRTASSASVPKLPPGAPASYRYNIDYITKGAGALSCGSGPHTQPSSQTARRPAGAGHTRTALSAPPRDARHFPSSGSEASLRARPSLFALSGESLFSAPSGKCTSSGKDRAVSMFSASSASSASASTSASSVFSASTSATTTGTVVSLPGDSDGTCEPSNAPNALESSDLFQAMRERVDPLAPSAEAETVQEYAARAEAERQRMQRWRIVAGILLARSTAGARPLSRRSLSASSIPLRTGAPALGVDVDGEGRTEMGSVRPWGAKGKGYVKSGLSSMTIVEV